MERKTHTNQTRWGLRKLSVISLAVILLLKGVFFLLEDRCSLITCKPARWSKIQEIIIDNTRTWNNEYRLSNEPFLIFELNEGGLKQEEVMRDIEIYVEYISTRETRNQSGPIYSTRTINFDDENLWVTSTGGLYPSLPSEKTLERFQKVQFGYRDIIGLTWVEASKSLISPIQSLILELSLEDRLQHDYGVEAIWTIKYANDERAVTFIIDALHGNIIQTNEK